VLWQIDWLEWCDQQIEVEIEFFSSFEAARSTVCIDASRFFIGSECDTALGVIAPGDGVVKSAKVVVNVDQRSFVVDVFEDDLHTCVHITQPDSVLLQHGIPFPVVGSIRALSTLHAQPHNIFCSIIRIVKDSSYIFDFHTLISRDFHLVFD